MKASHLFPYRLPTRLAVLLMLVSMGLSSCNLPRPAAGGQEPTDARTLATSQQSIQGTGQGTAPGKADMDCVKDGPWFLSVDHHFIQTMGDVTFTITVQGSATLTVDETGKVSGGPATGLGGEMESHAEDCTFMGLVKYTAKISGTCSRGVMNLSLEELLGEGGAVTGTMKCGDREPVTQYFGFPAMQHDLSIPLVSSAGGGLKTIPWGTGGKGSKNWMIAGSPALPLGP